MVNRPGRGAHGITARSGAILLGCLLVALGVAPARALDARYHTFAEMWAELQTVAVDHPSIAKLDTLGTTAEEGLAILALKISDNVAIDEDEPVVLYDGVHHAEEVMGLEICLWMVDELTTGYGVNDTITGRVNDCEIWFIPLMNPEGHGIVTAEIDTTWRKNKTDNNANGVFDPGYDGVDLNQNYDFNWELGGSDNPANEVYRGPAPFSESENRIMRDFCLTEKPVFATNYHSPRSSDGNVVYYPWYWTGHGFAPDHAVIYSVASTLATLTKTEAGESFTALYGFATSGRARNWQYGVVGTIGFDEEVLSNICQPSGDRVDGICQKTARGSYYLLDRTHGPGLTGHVTDASTGDPIVAEVKVVEFASDLLAPRTTEPVYGRYWRMLNQGTYTVEFSCPGYDTETVTGVVVGPTGLTVLDRALEPWAGVPAGEIVAPRIIRVAPNPMRGETRIDFTAPERGAVQIGIYSVGGRLIARLASGPTVGGRGTAAWDGRDLAGKRVASGVYFARLTADAGVDEAKVAFIQ
jgi:carboxypeptidase T